MHLCRASPSFQVRKEQERVAQLEEEKARKALENQRERARVLERVMAAKAAQEEVCQCDSVMV